MERVITVNLNGRAYQLEERAHAVLSAYIDRASATLAGNPDKAEILADLEQAIADKAAAYLNGHKQVVTGPEMTRILDEMGPVGGEESEGAAHSDEPPRAGATFSQEPPRKRLYRIKDGAVISGVSTGMAAYFDLDVALIRALWVVAAIFTNLLAVLVYVIMMFVVPSANTSEEWAAARGVPFNAQGVIDDAKRRYADFESRGGWQRWGFTRGAADPVGRVRRRARYRAERQAFREERRAWRREVREGAPDMAHPISPPVGYFTQVFAGFIAVVFSIVSAAFTIAFLLAVFSLATTGALFGHMPPVSLPIWLALVLLIVVYAAIATPIGAIRRASFRALSGRGGRGRDDGMDGILTLVLTGLFIWLAWRFIPGADAVVDSIVAWFNLIWREISL